MQYKKDELKDYIEKSEIREYSRDIKVRLSSDLAKKYDAGEYDLMLKKFQDNYDFIKLLNIKYPGNAEPNLYIYIVPDDEYVNLLNFPAIFNKGTGGGRPVPCYDLDGFNRAYGTSQNLMLNGRAERWNIAFEENNIHELSHLVHGQFFDGDSVLGEGFAETLPLYGLNYEEVFDDHRRALLELKEDEILSAQELLNQSKEGKFGATSINNHQGCTYRHSYISSYLFVRGCIEQIERKFNVTKLEAFQKFLEIVKTSNYTQEWRILDIGDKIGIDHEEILLGKTIQLNALNSLSLIEEQKKKITM